MTWLWLIGAIVLGLWLTDVLAYFPLGILRHLTIPGWGWLVLTIVGLTWLMGE